MRVIVISHHDDEKRRAFEGDEAEVGKALAAAFPILRQRLGGDAPAGVMVKALNRMQAYTAVEQEADLVLKAESDLGATTSVVAALVGHHDRLEAALAAARFLAGSPPEVDRAAARAAMARAGEDVERAALMAYGLDTGPAAREALRAVLATYSLAKTEDAGVPDIERVAAATTDGAAFAESVQRAVKEDEVQPVKLGGKHSSGTLLVRDPEQHVRYLLKPGAGPQNPAAGLDEVVASQSKREAAFYAVAKAWGLAAHVPEAHLLLLDGREYAAMKMLGFDYENFNDVKHKDPVRPRRLFHLYLGDGTLHKWAAMDFILGNADRNAGNVMARGDEIQLIDHGSAFAGPEFDPKDPSTFVPYYLRAMATDNFEDLPPDQAQRALPRLHGEAAKALGAWIAGLNRDELVAILGRFGIDPEGALQRLSRLQADSQHVAPDLAVNHAWTI